MNINKDNIQNFISDFQKIVDRELGKRYGVSIKVGNISYTNASFSTKMEVKNWVQGDDGQVYDAPNPLHERQARDALGAIAKNGIINHQVKLNTGDKMVCVDYNPRCTRYPFVCRREDGRLVKVTARSIVAVVA
jgi:hypothetical protein